MLPTTLTIYSCSDFESMIQIREANEKASESINELVEAD